MSESSGEQRRRWHVFPDAISLTQHAVEQIAASARAAIAADGAFHIVLAGGTTPRKIYEHMGDLKTDWNRWHVYLGDERCLPPADPERNSRMIFDAWLKDSPIPSEQVHFIPAELGAVQGAEAYSRVVSGIKFHMVLLGLGEDGHTASLFPAHEWGDGPDAPLALAVHDAPKPPPERISLSVRCLNAAERVLFIVTGASKQAAVSQWRGGVAIPAAAIAPEKGVDILVEQACVATR
jgi:6-phosphogluconolactonase